MDRSDLLALTKSAATILGFIERSADSDPEKPDRDALQVLQERDLSMSDLYGRVESVLDERVMETNDAWFWVQNIYADRSGQLYAIAVQRGKLFKFLVSVSGDSVDVGEGVEVAVEFNPIQRSQPAPTIKPFVRRTAEGTYQGLAILATSMMNKDGLIDSSTLFSRFAEKFDPEHQPYANVYHMNGSRSAIGRFTGVFALDNCLCAWFELDSTPIARAIGAGMAADTAGLIGWSIEFMPLESEYIEIGEFRTESFTDGDLYGASVCLTEHACSFGTAQKTITRNVEMFEDKYRGQIDQLVPPDFENRDQIIDEFVALVAETNAEARDAAHRTATAASEQQIAALLVRVDTIENQLGTMVDGAADPSVGADGDDASESQPTADEGESVPAGESDPTVDAVLQTINRRFDKLTKSMGARMARMEDEIGQLRMAEGDDSDADSADEYRPSQGDDAEDGVENNFGFKWQSAGVFAPPQ